MEPTKEQIKEFWEWCGFVRGQFEPHINGMDKYEYEAGWWMYPDNIMGSQVLPPIDLNNLFKYAVPKIMKTHSYNLTCDDEGNKHIASILFVPNSDAPFTEGLNEDEDPALALFWAIWEIINENPPR